MSAYIFEHDGKQFTPDGVVQVPSTADHNAQLQRDELARWATKPDHQIAYYHFPEEKGGGQYRASFYPNERGSYVTLWPGAVIGRITYACVYRHNFGSRMVSLRVQGNNGAEYHGRSSWDNGTCIRLHKSK